MLKLFTPYKVTKIDTREGVNYLSLTGRDGQTQGIIVDPDGFSKFMSRGGFDPNPVVGDELGLRYKDGVWQAQWMKEGNLCAQKVKTWEP